MIACAVAVVTYGAGAELLVADVSKLSPLQVAMLDAGYTALTTRAATLALTPDSGFEGFMKGMLSDETVRALATAMISAGLIAEAAPMLSDLGIDMSKTASFIDKLAVGVAEGSLRAIVDSAVNGNPLDENLKGALLSAAVGVIGAEAANVIGEAAQVGDLNKATQLIAHAALGCALGEASGGDCRSGAGGAVVGELTAWGYEAMTADELAADILALTKSASRPEETQALAHQMYAEWKMKGVNIAKVTAALAAAMSDADASTAAMTGGNAAENNAFFLVPVVVWAIAAAGTAWTAYDVYQAYEEGGPEEALKVLAVNGAITVVSAGTGKIAYKVGGMIISHADEAWVAWKAVKELDVNYRLEIQGLDVAAVNKRFTDRGPDWDPPYDPAKPVHSFVTGADEKFVRVYAEGTESKMRGSWMMRQSDIENLSPRQIQDKYALPQEPTHIVDVRVPKGSKMETGTANLIEGYGAGGNRQFQITTDMPKAKFEAMFSNSRILK